MKLMITQTIRITEAMESEISRLAEELGESKQTVIRLAIKEGLGIVERKLGTLGGQTGKENVKSDKQ